jgi:geranylgeranyl pyrophosphate synthase
MLSGEMTDRSRADLDRRLEATGAIGETRRRAHEFAVAARKNLDVLPETEYRVALGDLTTLVIERSV